MAYKFNSTIQQKTGECMDCQDGQQKPIIAGRCQFHYKLFREEERRKKSKERMIGEVDKVTEDMQNAWFLDRRKEMTGYCLLCNGKTTKDNDKEFKRSIAHLLAKRKNMFPSVASHPSNFIELCFYGNSCHTNMDNNMISLEELKMNDRIWNVIVAKFKKVYPHIAPNETKNIPEILLQEL